MNDQDRSLSAELAELADTMPDDPYRLEAVRARINRNRTRRRVGRTVAGVTIVGLTVVGVGLLRPAGSSVSTEPAAQPTAAPNPGPAADPALPSCAALPPPAAAPAESDASADSGKTAAAAAGQIADPGTGRRGVKSLGTVVAVTDASITVTVLAPGPGQPAEITAAFTDATLFYDDDTTLTARPTPNPGDQVAFAVVETGNGGYDVLLLQVHPLTTPTNRGTGDGEVSDAEKAAKAADESSPALMKNVAEIVSVQPGSLTLHLRGAPLTGQTVTAALAPDIVYLVGDQKCVDPVLVPGAVVGVLLQRGADASYTVERVALYAP
jgi:hypothetical protein